MDSVEIPADMVDECNAWRAKLIEAVAEQDDALLEKYFNGEELTVPEIKSGIRKGVLSLSMTPVLCGSALSNKGVQPLLDAVIDYFPSPTDIPPVKGHNMDGSEAERPASDDAPLSGLAFKIAKDQFGHSP